ncbi:hypothetical protein EYF80_010143 [Liparis tanakae]|uniref:Uncharacterized protein n=1 Tax=Liparis tanakae TaxID=230148 RepID=A0A4Z2IP09_9TELE|nr:hypothetical protein EYF80_010143 [Liparis tanakae]
MKKKKRKKKKKPSAVHVQKPQHHCKPPVCIDFPLKTLGRTASYGSFAQSLWHQMVTDTEPPQCIEALLYWKGDVIGLFSLEMEVNHKDELLAAGQRNNPPRVS